MALFCVTLPFMMVPDESLRESNAKVGLQELPVVALVGRPNVGKSTLFNRLSRIRKAVVDNTPGVTRDRNFAEVHWRKIPFLLIDTGGILQDKSDGLVGRIQQQTLLAVEEADFVIFVFDGREGINPSDDYAVNLLRRNQKRILFAVNKIDGDKQELAVNEFYRLGVETLFPISAAHGRGIPDILDALLSLFSAGEEISPDSSVNRPGVRAREDLKLAIVGRPNVGKSSLLNRIVGTERSIVDSEPGTTRDAIDTRVIWKDKTILLVDTAGVRRRTRIHEQIEQASAIGALKALERAEIGLLVFDAEQGMTDQDARLLRYAWQRGRGLIIVINKWDLIPSEKKHQNKFVDALHEEYPFTMSIPKIFLSALTGSRVGTLFPTAARVLAAHRTEIPTPVINRSLDDWTSRNPAPIYHRKPIRFYYATQVETRPPKIAIYTSNPRGVPSQYSRYLENQFRAHFELEGSPLRLQFRSRREERYPKKRGRT